MLYRPVGRFASPWRDMARLQREMNRLFERESRTTAPCYPAINVWTNEDGAVVTAELPGFTPEDIDVSVVGDSLTLSGNRKPDEVGEGGTYHRRERSCGRFTRAFQLPFGIEGNQVEAAFENGVLNITLPRAEADKPRKIAVKTA